MASSTVIHAPETPPAVSHDLRNYIAVRAFLLLLIFAQAIACSCQSFAAVAATPVPSSWQRVESLRPGTSLQVKMSAGAVGCAMVAADDDSLTCAHHGNLVFHRAAIVSVSLPHRGRSALIMGGIGAGVGVAVVKLVATVGFNGFFNGHAKGAVYGAGAGLGVLAFAPIGYATDLTHSNLYRAP
jgi:hypothetical protein